MFCPLGKKGRVSTNEMKNNHALMDQHLVIHIQNIPQGS